MDDVSIRHLMSEAFKNVFKSAFNNLQLDETDHLLLAWLGLALTLLCLAW